MTSDINIFRDPPTQAEIDGALRADSRRLTTGERIALGPGVLGLEVLVGAAVDAFNGESNFMTGKSSPWEVAPGAIDWNWSKSIFTESYANKVRAMKRDLVRCEVAALTRQISLEEKAVSAVKDAGAIAGNIAETIISNVVGKK
ncbi:TPA: hypothetical protein ACK3Q6_005644 [Burkholderia cepacia]|jgi:hypothetical protein|uniref:Uncharacterized protein n=3 Tax=Burkholderia cepacia complex TaxID=87882 RepID=A0A250LKU3_9BURK|nr:MULTISPECIES: hypothetical protein [Burkholderia]KKL36510.1 hypothetical protein WR31_25355 [Burkholderia contaminans LMG 23361]MBA9831111.1 hypothetical protein [Burkholderia contaminans]MBA9839169.1 hypothetical protein [Burkholderia contaminans]MBA9864479.1 hypothetical protein [Burkholderia contaminans]MBA9906751.1 hypothetical protein [Burkholderia contaminans]